MNFEKKNKIEKFTIRGERNETIFMRNIRYTGIHKHEIL